MKQREKWSGNMGQGQQESCRDIREKSKMDQKESTDILRSRKRIFQGRHIRLFQDLTSDLQKF